MIGRFLGHCPPRCSAKITVSRESSFILQLSRPCSPFTTCRMTWRIPTLLLKAFSILWYKTYYGDLRTHVSCLCLPGFPADLECRQYLRFFSMKLEVGFRNLSIDWMETILPNLKSNCVCLEPLDIFIRADWLLKAGPYYMKWILSKSRDKRTCLAFRTIEGLGKVHSQGP